MKVTKSPGTPVDAEINADSGLRLNPGTLKRLRMISAVTPAAALISRRKIPLVLSEKIIAKRAATKPPVMIDKIMSKYGIILISPGMMYAFCSRFQPDEFCRFLMFSDKRGADKKYD